MPDHLHFLAGGTDESASLLEFVRVFKQKSEFVYRQNGRETLWQGRFYEHILRTAEDIEGVGRYIWMNPVRKGICQNPLEYPLSGSMTLDWMARKGLKAEWIPPWKARESDGLR